MGACRRGGIERRASKQAAGQGCHGAGAGSSLAPLPSLPQESNPHLPALTLAVASALTARPVVAEAVLEMRGFTEAVGLAQLAPCRRQPSELTPTAAPDTNACRRGAAAWGGGGQQQQGERARAVGGWLAQALGAKVAGCAPWRLSGRRLGFFA